MVIAMHRQTSPISARYTKVIALVPLLVGLAACAKPIDQEVTGRLSSLSGAAAGAQLRLYESTLCSGNYFEASTNKDGEFSFRTNTVRDATSRAKQALTLCQKRNAFWHAIWTSEHPAGAARIELACTVQNKVAKGACEPRFNYGA